MVALVLLLLMITVYFVCRRGVVTGPLRQGRDRPEGWRVLTSGKCSLMTVRAALSKADALRFSRVR